MSQGLAPIEVSLGAGVTALFTTRSGGSSPAPWDSLNLGLNVADDAARVTANRARVAALLGGPLVFVTQVHGNEVLTLARAAETTARETAVRESAVPETSAEFAARAAAVSADALVTAVPGVVLAITVADCVPVLLADARHRVVAAVHAGRGGVSSGVVGRAVTAMRDAGAEQVSAVVGPCVCGECYEVPEAMRAELVGQDPAAFAVTRQGTPALDLRAAVAAQLAEAGVLAVSHVLRCTMEDPELFSHRRASAASSTTGRFAAVIALDADGGSWRVGTEPVARRPLA